jgi:hypothetical protein
MFQEGVQIRKLHGDYGVHTEPSLKGRGMKITPKFPIAESRDSSKNQGTCPRPELSPQAQKRKIEPSWPDQASGSAVGQDSSWPASNWQAASSWQDHARPQVPWEQSRNSRPACQVPVARAPWSTSSWQGSSHQGPNWHESNWKTLVPSPMSSNWQVPNWATTPSPMSSNWQAANWATTDTQNPANARAQHNANKFQTQAERALVQLREKLKEHSDPPNAFRNQADDALEQLGTHLRQNSPAEALTTSRMEVFEALTHFHQFDLFIKGEKNPGQEAAKKALAWVTQVTG